MSGKNGTADKVNHYGPSQGYTKLPNKVIDRWGRHIVRTLGSAHAWVLTVVVRLTIGYGKKSREVSAPALARLTGLSRARVCEVLEDLEAVGVVTRERRPGCSTRLGVNLEWQPSSKVLEKGKRLRRERSKRKHPDDQEDANPSTGVDAFEDHDPATPVDGNPSTGADGLPSYRGGHPNPSTPVDTIKDSLCIESLSIDYDDTSENGESLPKKEFFGSETGPSNTFIGEEEKITPPPPSSSSYPVSKINKESENYLKEIDDDEKDKNSSKTQIGDGREESLDGESESRTAPKKSWQMVSDEIKTIPSKRISDEARGLAEALEEKLPRIDKTKLERLSQYTIEAEATTHLGATVASIEKDLKYKVDNPWSYLIKTLWPLPDFVDEGNGETPCKRFKDAYASGRTRYTLRGQFDKHQHEGVAGPTKPTEDYIERFE